LVDLLKKKRRGRAVVFLSFVKTEDRSEKRRAQSSILR